jgi:hypothetical protein
MDDVSKASLIRGVFCWEKMMTTQPPNQISVSSSAFREREIKINAPDCETLDAIKTYLLNDPHYVSKTAPERIPAYLNGLSFHTAQSETPLRARFYYDDLNLSAFKNGIEIRLEPKKQQGKAWVFDQTVKIVKTASDDAHTMLDRLEYKDLVKGRIPDLTDLPREVKDRLKDIFNVERTKDIHLHPLLLTVGQRWKMAAHPDGDKNTLVEYATDRARGFTADKKFQWDILQIEMELKKGGSDVLLAAERQRLTSRFNGLIVETHSKPTEGFVCLDQLSGREKKALERKVSNVDSPFTVFPQALALYR